MDGDVGAKVERPGQGLGKATVSPARLGAAIVAAGFVVAIVAWRSDQLGLTADNRTIDPWQTVTILLGFAIMAAGVGLAISSLPSDRTTVGCRALAGAALVVTTVGWFLMAGSVYSLTDCRADPSCSFGYAFNPSRYTFNFIPDWQIAMTLAALATVVAVWGLIGLWRSNDLSPRASVAAYWIGSVATWVLMISIFTIGFSLDD